MARSTPPLIDVAQTAAATAINTPVTAGMARRLGAMGYDGLLILGIVMLVHFPLVMTLGHAVPRRLSWALWVMSTVLFYTYFWVRHGRTLGMQAWRFELRSDAGNHRVTITQALLRFMVLMPALLLIEAGRLFPPAIIVGLVYLQANLLWMWFNPARKTWSDLISGSRMLRTDSSGRALEQPRT